jgi:hypothetical protein
MCSGGNLIRAGKLWEGRNRAGEKALQMHLSKRIAAAFLADRHQVWFSVTAINSESRADRRFLTQFMAGCDTRGGRNHIGNNHCQEHLEDPLLRDLAGKDGLSVIDRDQEGANHQRCRAGSTYCSRVRGGF